MQAVRMKVLKNAVGGHDPRVLQGSTIEKGINWNPGDEIVVTAELAGKFEASGMAERVVEPAQPEVAALATTENVSRNNSRPRARV